MKIKQAIICKRCGREYLGGYDELVDLNKPLIDSELEKLGKEAIDDELAAFDKFIKGLNRKNR